MVLRNWDLTEMVGLSQSCHSLGVATQKVSMEKPMRTLGDASRAQIPLDDCTYDSLYEYAPLRSRCVMQCKPKASGERKITCNTLD